MIKIKELVSEISDFLDKNELKEGKYEFVFNDVRVIIEVNSIKENWLIRDIAWGVLEIWKESEDNGRSNKNVNA